MPRFVRAPPSLVLNERLLGLDKVEFIRHALVRMQQRGISRDEVFHTIRNPDKVGLPTAPGRQRVRWIKSVNFSIDVVYELLSDRVRIITTMRVNDASRGIAPKVFRIGKQLPRKRKRGRR
jgi:hypothetical protein